MPPSQTHSGRVNPFLRAAIERSIEQAGRERLLLLGGGTVSFRIGPHPADQKPVDKPDDKPDDKSDDNPEHKPDHNLNHNAAEEPDQNPADNPNHNPDHTHKPGDQPKVKTSTRFAFLEVPKAKSSDEYERYTVAVALILKYLPSRVVVIATEKRSDWIEILGHDQIATTTEDPMIKTEPISGSPAQGSEVIPIYRYHFNVDEDLWDEKMRSVTQVLAKPSTRKERIIRSAAGRFLVHPPASSIIASHTTRRAAAGVPRKQEKKGVSKKGGSGPDLDSPTNT
ncbi:hypothetical protein MAPG_10443 [Magnaporthiopsis poae ATCC 64411]|uniref:Uncharacterized protein n=1 Tax=Magnaporthiopsis poae (strain ATCC 64411 / 73-15) TaxID=644358 RepID=A0A0C4ECL4_MAGP6|nr:hypothetical protein MAPG_10443 [Magnaporthiopsis poae ATCC 64411]